MAIVPVHDGSAYPRLVFKYGVDEAEEYNSRMRGFRGDMVLEFENGDRYPLHFEDAECVRSGLESARKWRSSGCGQYVAEPGPVIIPEVTVANMRAAVASLIKVGYFDHLRPLGKDEPEDEGGANPSEGEG